MPKSYGRNERIAASLRREAARILSSEIKDPRVKLATVTEVNVAPDLRNATIFVSLLNDNEEQIKETMLALNKARGFVRSTMAAHLKMRYMPNITFEYDNLVKDSMKLDALIAKGLNSKDENTMQAKDDDSDDFVDVADDVNDTDDIDNTDDINNAGETKETNKITREESNMKE